MSSKFNIGGKMYRMQSGIRIIPQYEVKENISKLLLETFLESYNNDKLEDRLERQELLLLRS